MQKINLNLKKKKKSHNTPQTQHTNNKKFLYIDHEIHNQKWHPNGPKILIYKFRTKHNKQLSNINHQ